MPLFTSVRETGSSGERRNTEVLGVVLHCKLDWKEIIISCATKKKRKKVILRMLRSSGVNTDINAVICSLLKFGCLLVWEYFKI